MDVLVITCTCAFAFITQKWFLFLYSDERYISVSASSYSYHPRVLPTLVPRPDLDNVSNDMISTLFVVKEIYVSNNVSIFVYPFSKLIKR